MKTASAALLALVAGASAHTLMSEIYIDGKPQGDATCIRTPSDARHGVDPVEDLSSTDMACGHNGETGVATVCGIDGGQTLTFEFREWPDDVSKGAMDIGHKGPCAVYAKKVDNATTDGAVGAGWFKLWDEGFDESANKWCTEKVIEANGHLSIIIPDTLQGGEYLIRSELIALHNANLSPPDPQYYVGCAQMFLSSSGSVVPDSADTVSIPGYTSMEDAGNTFNIYAEPKALPYPMPGPKPYNGASTGVSRIASTVTKQTDGLPPANYIVKNANWYGVELEKYSTEDACWAQSKLCWNQVDDCYAKAPPTGSTGCKAMENKCNNLDDQCNAKNFDGPPDYMMVLTPPGEAVSDLPAPVNANNPNNGADGSSNAPASSSAPSSSAAAPSSSAAAPSSEAAYSAPASSEAAPSSYAAPSTSSEAAYSAPAYTAPAYTAPAYTAPAYTPTSASPTTLVTSAVQSFAPVSSAPAWGGYGKQHGYKADDSSDDVEVVTATADDVAVVTVNDYDYVTVETTVYATETAAPAYRRGEHRHFGHRRSHN